MFRKKKLFKSVVLALTAFFHKFYSVTVLSEVGNSARGYCEISGRVEPVLGDVIMALINMGKKCLLIIKQL